MDGEEKFLFDSALAEQLCSHSDSLSNSDDDDDEYSENEGDEDDKNRLHSENEREALENNLRDACLTPYSSASPGALPRFVQVNENDGTTQYIKKSTVVWHLKRSSGRKLSNDRLLRVRQSTSITTETTTITEASKQNTVRVGDWCVFTTTNQKEILLGRIVSLSSENNSRKSNVMLQCDLEKQGKTASALCNWYKFEQGIKKAARKPSAGNKHHLLSGTLIPAYVQSHGFYPLRYYVCSSRPPEVDSRDPENPSFMLSQAVIDRINEIING